MEELIRTDAHLDDRELDFFLGREFEFGDEGIAATDEFDYLSGDLSIDRFVSQHEVKGSKVDAVFEIEEVLRVGAGEVSSNNIRDREEKVEVAEVAVSMNARASALDIVVEFGRSESDFVGFHVELVDSGDILEDDPFREFDLREKVFVDELAPDESAEVAVVEEVLGRFFVCIENRLGDNSSILGFDPILVDLSIPADRDIRVVFSGESMERLEIPGLDQVVGIDKRNVLTFGLGDAAIAGSSMGEVFGVTDGYDIGVLTCKIFDSGGSIVGRIVVDNNELVVSKRLLLNRLDSVGESIV